MPKANGAAGDREDFEREAPIDLLRARVMKQLGLPVNHPVDPRVRRAMARKRNKPHA